MNNVNKQLIHEAAQGNIKRPTTKTGSPKKLSAAKRKKLLSHLSEIQKQANELSEQLQEIDSSIRS